MWVLALSPWKDTSLLNIPVTLEVTVLKAILDCSVTKTKENQAGAGKM